MRILQYPDPFLRRTVAPVVDAAALSTFVAEMDGLLSRARGDGLAAVQVGLDARVVVVSGHLAVGDGLPVVLFNPVLDALDGATVTVEQEGCLSFPGVSVAVPRPDGVLLTAEHRDGRIVGRPVAGRLARVLQHEVDHLDGRLIIDFLPRRERGRVLETMTRRR